jgi:hypothetical protein
MRRLFELLRRLIVDGLVARTRAISYRPQDGRRDEARQSDGR